MTLNRKRRSLSVSYLSATNVLANKKAHPINQMSSKYEKIFEACYLTYLLRIFIRLELAPFLSLVKSKERLSRLHRAITLCLS
jgi:hypothetical protein